MTRLGALLLLVLAGMTGAEAEPAPGALREVALAALSEQPASALGRAALTMRATEWKHGETEHFIYHFFQSFIATPVSVEAEFFYRFNVQELGMATPKPAPKCHIYIFEEDRDWAAFQQRAALDPWTGGVLAGRDLFIQRNPALRWKGDTLGHEVTHLVLHQVFGPALPLWLNEGYAEFAATRGYASFHRARGYAAKPRVDALAAADYLPLTKLLAARTYPGPEAEAAAFYAEAQKLVRFLARTDPGSLLKLLAGGAAGEKSLRDYLAEKGEEFSLFEKRFQTYAIED